MKYKHESIFVHGQSRFIGVILVNLGTPAELSVASIRSYLQEFLSDSRVIEMPSWVWNIILRTVVLPFRPRALLSKYSKIWLSEGSPLRVHTLYQAKNLQKVFDQSQSFVRVRYAMRYGSPSLEEVYDELRDLGCDRFLLFPLYPQYASSTTGSVYDAFFSILGKCRYIPEIKLIHHFHTHKAYIDAMAVHIRDFWSRNAITDKLLFSFHGIPRISWTSGDPYPCYCHQTARLIAEELNLSKDQYEVCFQSRFGRANWVEPYTVNVIKKMASSGHKKITVVSPSFVSDCLETLEEISIELRDVFFSYGGEEFYVVPSLNDSHFWISALEKIVSEQLGTWLIPDSAEELECVKRRAMIAHDSHE
ncbi:ferrochelatase [Candidatus Ichthyocystis hellenicum]|uniref:ferrochelatase n=1 Tax=Candidatus Ichthyocystis hellenicum TaxID=1561003 RepID=UPI000AB86087|nr:ferrochelatase [Candidatus Ichthyocystis hellenicum]